MSAWADQSGQANNATQGTANAQPAYSASGFSGGQPCIQFSQSPNSQGLALAVSPVTNGACTIYAASQDTVDSVERAILKMNGSNLFACNVNFGTYEIGWQEYGSGISSASIIGTLVTSYNSLVLRKNGTPSSTLTSGTGWYTGAASVGYDSGLGSNPYNGSIAEIVVYSRVLTTSEAQQLERYMGARYGITVS